MIVLCIMRTMLVKVLNILIYLNVCQFHIHKQNTFPSFRPKMKISP